MARPGAHEAMRQLRREIDHLLDQALNHVLAEARARKGGEKHRVSAGEQEPLEVGEQGVWVVSYGFSRQIKGDGVFRSETRGREAFHQSSNNVRRSLMSPVRVARSTA